MIKEKIIVNVWNDFYTQKFELLCSELEKGFIVVPYVDCIGHIRNNWVQEAYKEDLIKKYGESLKVNCSECTYSYHYEYELKGV